MQGFCIAVLDPSSLLYNIPLYGLYHNLYFHSPVDGFQGFFFFLVRDYMNKASMNIFFAPGFGCIEALIRIRHLPCGVVPGLLDILGENTPR